MVCRNGFRDDIGGSIHFLANEYVPCNLYPTEKQYNQQWQRYREFNEGHPRTASAEGPYPAKGMQQGLTIHGTTCEGSFWTIELAVIS